MVVASLDAVGEQMAHLPASLVDRLASSLAIATCRVRYLPTRADTESSDDSDSRGSGPAVVALGARNVEAGLMSSAALGLVKVEPV